MSESRTDNRMDQDRERSGSGALNPGKAEVDVQELLYRLVTRMESEKAAEQRAEGEIEIDLQALLYRLLDKWMYIVGAALVGAIVMAIVSFGFITPKYEATSKLYVLSSNDSAINLSDLQIGAYLTSDYQEVFSTWEVHQQVIDNLGLEYSYEEIENGMLTIENPSDTRILRITVRSEDPQEARDMANEYANVAKKYIGDTMKTEEPMIMSQALLPIKPVSPRKALNTFLGFVIGGFLAAAVVVLQYIQDDKTKTADEIMKYASMATLAVVPAEESDSSDEGAEEPDENRGERE